MSIISEIQDLIKSLDAAETWDDSTLDASIEYYLRRTLRSPVRAIRRSDLLFSYHLDLKKKLYYTYKECLIFTVRLSAELGHDLLNKILESIRYIILKEGLSGQPHLIFIFGGDHDIKRYFEDEFWGSVISDEKGFLEWLKKASPEKEVLSWLKMGALEMTKCPFQYLGPCSPDMFVGREKLIRGIFIDSQVGYAIAGGRRIGKTSLLFKLQSEIKEGKKSYSTKEYQSLYIDCSNFATFHDLMKDISIRLFPKYYLGHSADGYEFSFNKILNRVKGLWDKTLILLLDEMDSLVEKAKEKSEDSNVFFNSLRAEANKGSVKLVITGFRDVSKMIQNPAHPFYNLCEKKRIGVLENHEVSDLISRTFSRMGITLKPKKEIISKIWGVAAGHPSLVQFIAKQLFQSRQGNTITLEDFNRVINSEESIEFILDNFVLNTNDLESLLCLLVLEEKEFTNDTVLEIMQKKGIELENPAKKVYTALRNLTFNNILLHDHGRYRFLYPLMRNIIKEYYLSPNLISTLKREVEK
jgi:hypothetical protein